LVDGQFAILSYLAFLAETLVRTANGIVLAGNIAIALWVVPAWVTFAFVDNVEFAVAAAVRRIDGNVAVGALHALQTETLLPSDASLGTIYFHCASWHVAELACPVPACFALAAQITFVLVVDCTVALAVHTFLVAHTVLAILPPESKVAVAKKTFFGFKHFASVHAVL